MTETRKKKTTIKKSVSSLVHHTQPRWLFSDHFILVESFYVFAEILKFLQPHFLAFSHQLTEGSSHKRENKLDKNMVYVNMKPLKNEYSPPLTWQLVEFFPCSFH